MDSPLRLIASNPLDQLARTLEALLVVASAPLSVEELAEAADDNTGADRGAPSGWSASATPKGAAGSCSSTSRAAGRSAPPREATEACARLFDKPGAAEPLASGAGDARDRGVPRAVLAAGHRSHPGRRRRLGGCEPARARIDRRSRAGRCGGRRDPLPHDTLFERIFGLEACRLCRASTTSAPTRSRSASGCTSRRAAHGVEAKGASGTALRNLELADDPSASSRVKARNVSVCSAPWRWSFVMISRAVSSSGASKTSTTSYWPSVTQTPTSLPPAVWIICSPSSTRSRHAGRPIRPCDVHFISVT